MSGKTVGAKKFQANRHNKGETVQEEDPIGNHPQRLKDSLHTTGKKYPSSSRGYTNKFFTPTKLAAEPNEDDQEENQGMNQVDILDAQEQVDKVGKPEKEQV